MTTLSLCMIVRNEEQFLEQCLSSVLGLADEIIVVDTGSTDRTKEIALRFTSKVFDFPWNDDFAAARNESIKHASGDWILILDADEALAGEEHAAIRKAIADASSQGIEAFRILTKNYDNDSSYSGWQPALQDDTFRKSFFGWHPSVKVRLFRRSPGVVFEGAVHELVELFLQKGNRKIADLPIVVHHYGALREDKKAKQQWHLSLAERKAAAAPGDARASYELGVLYKELERYADAEKAFQRSLGLEPSFIESLLELAIVQQKQGKLELSMKHFQEVVVRKESAEAYFGLGYCLFLQGRLAESLTGFQAAIERKPSFVEAYANAGAVAEKLGKLPEAERLLRQALSLFPFHARAQYNLGVVYEKAAQENAARRGEGNPLAWKLALECYEKALAQGYPQQKVLQERVEKIREALGTITIQ